MANRKVVRRRVTPSQWKGRRLVHAECNYALWHVIIALVAWLHGQNGRPAALLGRVKSNLKGSQSDQDKSLPQCWRIAYAVPTHKQLWLLLGLLQLFSGFPLWSTFPLLEVFQVAHANCMFQSKLKYIFNYFSLTS